jgi:hypothetical protein
MKMLYTYVAFFLTGIFKTYITESSPQHTINIFSFEKVVSDACQPTYGLF